MREIEVKTMILERPREKRLAMCSETKLDIPRQIIEVPGKYEAKSPSGNDVALPVSREMELAASRAFFGMKVLSESRHRFPGE